MLRILFDYRLTGMLSLVILTFCLITVPKTTLSQVDNIDKIAHFVFFFGLALVAWWESAGRKAQHLGFWIRFLLIGCATIGLGGLIEVLQATCTGGRRSGEWLDFVADGIGSTLALLIGILLAKYYAKG